MKWRGAAECLINERWMYDKAADFLLIAGDGDEAKRAILRGIEDYEVHARVDNFGELPRLKERLARYFN
jgi:hypothetical protein